MSVEVTPLTGMNSDKRTNMVVLEIALPSGFIVNTNHLNSLKNSVSIVKRIETKYNDTVAIELSPLDSKLKVKYYIEPN